MSQSVSSDKPIVILGQGIAGVSLVWALVQAGVQPERIHWVGFGESAESVPSGASWTPVALINPATGPSAKLIPDAEVALSHTYSLIDWIQTMNILHSSPNFHVLRPAASRDMAEKMRQRIQQDPWPAAWQQWLEPEECAAQFPRVFHEHGALWIKQGGHVPMPSFLQQATKKALSEGITLASTTTSDITQWLEKGTVLCATGASTQNLTTNQQPVWPDLGLHQVKGQMMTIRLQNAEEAPKTAISMKGYLAPTETPGEVAVGSTYEHHFEHTEFDEQGRQKLLGVAKSILPNTRFDHDSIRGWAAVRVHQPPERLPVIAKHSTISGLYVFTGFGSKGLTLAPAAAVRFTQRLLRAV